MNRLAMIVAVLCVGVACTNIKEGRAVAHPEPPRDVWQLAQRAVDAVPLTVAKMNALLGVDMREDPQTPGRWEAGRVALAPGLTVVSATLGMKGANDSWNFAYIAVELEPCVSVDEVIQHYPAATMRGPVTWHTPVLIDGVGVEYPWGDLEFGYRTTDRCVVDLSLERARATPAAGELRAPWESGGSAGAEA